MIESNPYIKTQDPQQKANVGVNTMLGLGAGGALGQVATFVAPVSDEYVAKVIEEDLSKKITAKAGYDLKDLAKSFIKNSRAESWEVVGAIAGAGIALVYSLIKNSKIQKAENNNQ